MKRLSVVIIVAVVLVAGIALFFMLRTPGTSPQAVLPNPNGYDDFAAAAQWLVAPGGDLLRLPPEKIRAALGQNSKALETIRSGLKKQSAVPVTSDTNWFTLHMVQVGTHKSMAQLLVAEGIIHLEEGRTNEAARAFADGIAFAHAAHHGGLMIDNLVGIMCQAIGAQRLAPVAPHLSPGAVREILPRLIALDQAREPASAILERDREWFRGVEGPLRSAWARIVTRKMLRAAEVRFEKTHARSVAALRLVMTDLAIRGYEATNGKPPMDLAELVPNWLPAVPLDPFSNQPLIYRATTNSFLLYSVGPDGQDDGGSPFKQGKVETGDLLPTAL